MNRYLLTIVYLSCYSFCTYSQQKQSKSPDVIRDVATLALINPTDQKLSLHIGQSLSKCQKVLGKPAQIIKEYWETEDDTGTIYVYGKNKLFFLKNKFERYHLQDSSIWVGSTKGQTFKINDSISKHSPKYFLDFPLIYEVESYYNINHAVSGLVKLKNGKSRLDSYCVLLFDKHNKLIFIALESSP